MLLETTKLKLVGRVRCVRWEHCLIDLFRTDGVATHVAEMVVDLVIDNLKIKFIFKFINVLFKIK